METIMKVVKTRVVDKDMTARHKRASSRAKCHKAIGPARRSGREGANAGTN